MLLLDFILDLLNESKILNSPVLFYLYNRISFVLVRHIYVTLVNVDLAMQSTA